MVEKDRWRWNHVDALIVEHEYTSSPVIEHDDKRDGQRYTRIAGHGGSLIDHC